MPVEREYTGFGCRTSGDPHRVEVHIPRRTGEVVVLEDFGDCVNTERIHRCRLARPTWVAIAPTVRADFNDRLRDAGLPAGRWKSGENRLDRLLGKELCVLAWGVEVVTGDAVQHALRSWRCLSPEERWWLFTKVVTNAGTSDDADIGWRKAIRIALTET